MHCQSPVTGLAAGLRLIPLQAQPPPPPPADARGGQRRGQLPSSLWTRHGAVKQGQSGGPVGATFQGKGRVGREVRIGRAGRGRAQGGERPMGRRLSRERVQGKGTSKRPSANGRRQLQTATQPGAMPNPPPDARFGPSPPTPGPDPSFMHWGLGCSNPPDPLGRPCQGCNTHLPPC